MELLAVGFGGPDFDLYLAACMGIFLVSIGVGGFLIAYYMDRVHHW